MLGWGRTRGGRWHRTGEVSAIEMTYRRLRRTGSHATRVSAEPVRRRRSVFRLRSTPCQEHRLRRACRLVSAATPIGLPKVVIGVSGGLGSSHTLIVVA